MTSVSFKEIRKSYKGIPMILWMLRVGAMPLIFGCCMLAMSIWWFSTAENFGLSDNWLGYASFMLALIGVACSYMIAFEWKYAPLIKMLEDHQEAEQLPDQR